MKKIAYFTSEYPAISHTFIIREIEALRALGYEVCTASVHRPEHLEIMPQLEQQEAARTLYIMQGFPACALRAGFARLLRDPVGLFRMKCAAFRLNFRGPRSLLKMTAYLAEALILLDWMERNGVRHVHVHFGNPSATVAMLAAASGRIEYSLSIHGPDLFYSVDRQMLADKLRGAVFVRAISWFCYSQLARLLPASEWGRIHIVRCGIDPDAFAPPQPKPETDVPEILCLGRICPAKAQPVLVRAAAILRDRGVSFRLVFAGDGPERAPLVSLCNELGLEGCVEFAGAVARDRVYAFYDRAAVFVLPSFAEGVPVVLMEAMAKQVPVVSSRVMGIPELIEHEEGGMLAAPGNAAEVADVIQRLLEDAGLRKRLGEGGRRKVCESYNLEINCRLLAQVFDEYLKGTDHE